MTISVAKNVSPDLFVENDSLMFDRERAIQHADVLPPAAALTFIAVKSETSHNLEELAAACGKEAMGLIKKVLHENYRSWLFVSERFWMPEIEKLEHKGARISGYKKLWRSHVSLIASGENLRIGTDIEIELEGFIRYAGLLEISCDACCKAINAVRTNHSFVMFVSKRPDIDSVEGVISIFRAAFPRVDGNEQVNINWLSLAMKLCTQGDILLRVNGLFDDREAAVDIIANKEIILNLWGSV